MRPSPPIRPKIFFGPAHFKAQAVFDGPGPFKVLAPIIESIRVFHVFRLFTLRLSRVYCTLLVLCPLRLLLLVLCALRLSSLDPHFTDLLSVNLDTRQSVSFLSPSLCLSVVFPLVISLICLSFSQSLPQFLSSCSSCSLCS